MITVDIGPVAVAHHLSEIGDGGCCSGSCGGRCGLSSGESATWSPLRLPDMDMLNKTGTYICQVFRSPPNPQAASEHHDHESLQDTWYADCSSCAFKLQNRLANVTFFTLVNITSKKHDHLPVNPTVTCFSTKYVVRSLNSDCL